MSVISDKDYHIGNRLKDLRRNRGLSQMELAAAIKKKTGINISRQNINKLENNRTVPNIDTLCTLADFFEVSIDYLMSRDNCTSVDSQYIHDQLGLSDAAIKALKRYKKIDSDNYKELLSLAKDNKVPDKKMTFILPVLNYLFSNKHFQTFIELFSVMVHDNYQVPVFKDKKGFKVFPSYLNENEDYIYFSSSPGHPADNVGIKIDSDFRMEINKNLLTRTIVQMVEDYRKKHDN